MPKYKIFISYDSRDRIYYSHIKTWFTDDTTVELCNDIIPSSSIADSIAEKIGKASYVLVLISEFTKNPSEFLLKEILTAKEMNKPIIAVNINGLRSRNASLCPKALSNYYALHIPFNKAVINYAMSIWKDYYEKNHNTVHNSARLSDKVYQKLGL